MSFTAKIGAGLLFAASCFSVAYGETNNANAKAVEARKVKTSGKYVANPVIVAHDGKVWFGDTLVVDRATQFRLYAYDAETLELEYDNVVRHSVVDINVAGDRVVAFGKKADPWHNGITSVREVSPGNFRSSYERHDIYHFYDRMRWFGEWYFIDVGTRSIRKGKTRRFAKVGGDVSGPRNMIKAGSNLWIIEGNSFRFGDETIAVTDLTRNTTKHLFRDQLPTGIDSIVYHQDTNTVLFNERLKGNVVIMDAEGDHEYVRVSVEGEPQGLAHYGDCVAVVNTESRMIHFIDPATETQVDTWKMDVPVPGFELPRRLAVDEASGDIFVRAAAPCYAACEKSPNSVYRFRDTSGETATTCNL